jgi:hypothetical protein
MGESLLTGSGRIVRFCRIDEYPPHFPSVRRLFQWTSPFVFFAADRGGGVYGIPSISISMVFPNVKSMHDFGRGHCPDTGRQGTQIPCQRKKQAGQIVHTVIVKNPSIAPVAGQKGTGERTETDFEESESK